MRNKIKIALKEFLDLLNVLFCFIISSITVGAWMGTANRIYKELSFIEKMEIDPSQPSYMPPLTEVIGWDVFITVLFYFFVYKRYLRKYINSLDRFLQKNKK